MIGIPFRKRSHTTAKNRHSRKSGKAFRRATFEPLETRQLLTISLPTIASQTVLAGAPLNLALDVTESEGHAVSYSVSVANSTLQTSSGTSATLGTLLSTSNPSLKLTIDSAANSIHGDVILQLFQDLAPKTVAKIQSLVNSDYYNGLIFHRVIKDFMIQGGDPLGTGSGGPGYQFDDEYNAALQFTGTGLLAMANSGPDSNGSQFFITTSTPRHLDFRHSIFGMVTEGYSIVDQIDNISVDGNSKPNSNVVITDATMITDNQNGVLRLSAPIGTTGQASVTVTARDSVTGETTSQTFQVTVSADSNNERPYLNTISPISTNANTPINYYIPATDVDGGSIYYDAGVYPENANITTTVNHTTGLLTITPNGTPGVYSVEVGVRETTASTGNSENVWDTQYIPVYVNPAAPNSITLTTDTGTNTTDKITNLNNTSTNKLSFQVSGVVSGATVELFSDGTLIGTGIATGTSITITTNGSFTLTDGSHVITARQTLKNKAVDVGNVQTTTDLASPVSTNYTITVETTPPQFDFVPVVQAIEGVPYTTQVVATDSPVGGVTYSLSQKPAGMLIDQTTGVITWTPPVGSGSSAQVTVVATDAAGNTAQRLFGITIATANAAPVLVPATPTLANTDETSPLTIDLSETLVNNGNGTTTITDTDEDAVKGGIAIVGVTGRGTWQYSLDGTTYQTASSISATSALLLPKDASLRYIPDGANGESVSFTYRAWDTKQGVAGGRSDLSASTAVGGSTAFSTATDTATFTVTGLNNAPVITAVNPSLGITGASAPITIPLLGSFINNGSGKTTIADADQNSVVGGIALVAITGAGTWEYTLDGTNYLPVGTIGDNSALLLPRTASLRYTPVTADQTATIRYRAWDTTTGAAGDHVDLSTSAAVGGVTAFSSATDIATLKVNDAPVLTTIAPSLGSTNEDTEFTVNLSGTFINNGSGTTTISDVNQNAAIGGIAITAVTGGGTWKYSLDGTTFVTITGVSSTSALLLPATAKLRYTPDGKNGELATISYRAWDTTSGTAGNRGDLSQAAAVGGTTAFSTASDTASLTVTGLNDAPVITAVAPSMGVTTLNAPTTINISGTFINNGTTTTGISDLDDDAVTGGIAITASAGTGTWEYSLDGTTFTALGTVSASSALLLPKEAKLRFTPTGIGSAPTITYRAWDKTTGTAGARVDLSQASSLGGTTAYSTGSDTASLSLQTSSLAGFVYLDTDNDGLRQTTTGQTHLALPGVVVKLFNKNAQGNWVEVTGKSPVLTGSDGSYRFSELAVGTYRIQEVQPVNFLDGTDSLGKIANAVRGTASEDQFELQLNAGENATEYNFGEHGLKPARFSLQMLLASAPSAAQFITQINATPIVDLATSTTGVNHSTAYYSTGSPVAIAAANASISDVDSPMLASMTATISNLHDGSSEKLEAVTTGTPLSASYANGVLTLSGTADRSVYEQVLRSIKYSDTATTPNTEDRKIKILVHDGLVSSQAATSNITINRAAAALAAVDEALKNDNWLFD